MLLLIKKFPAKLWAVTRNPGVSNSKLLVFQIGSEHVTYQMVATVFHWCERFLEYTGEEDVYFGGYEVHLDDGRVFRYCTHLYGVKYG